MILFNWMFSIVLAQRTRQVLLLHKVVIQPQLCLVLSLLVQPWQGAQIILTQPPCRMVLLDKVVMQPQVCQMHSVRSKSATSSSDNLDTASLPSSTITQSSYSASIVFRGDLYSTGTIPTSSSDNLDTASLPNGSITQSSYSAPTVSEAKLTGTSATGSSDNLGTASPPRASTTHSSYSASTVSCAEFTGTTPTRSSDCFGTASLPSGSTRQNSSSEITGTSVWQKVPIILARCPCRVVLLRKVAIQPYRYFLQS